MASVRGSCYSCREPLVYLRIIDGEVMVVVACHDCKVENHFSLQSMISALHSDKPDFDQMLADFVPKGKPS